MQKQPLTAHEVVAQRWKGLVPFLCTGSSLTVHACHPCGALHAHWACRMFSGPGN